MTDGEKLKAFFSKMPRKQKSAYISRIQEACKIKRYKVYNFMSGLSRIEPLYKEIIEREIGIKIFD